MSEAEGQRPAPRGQDDQTVSVEDVRRLMGPSTPHFALQLRDRIASLIAGLPEGHPAIKLAIRSRSCRAKWGVEGPINRRTSSTLTVWSSCPLGAGR